MKTTFHSMRDQAIWFHIRGFHVINKLMLNIYARAIRSEKAT